MRLFAAFIIFICFNTNSIYAQDIYSVKDGDWEDSSTWSVPLTNDTLQGKTILLKNNVKFSGDLRFLSCQLIIDSQGCLCGHDSIWLNKSSVSIYGGFYADYVYGETSNWYALGAKWIVSSFIHWIGDGDFVLVDCELAKVGGCFVCNIPVEVCEDTFEIDTLNPPEIDKSIAIYPNPFISNFNVDTNLPSGDSLTTFTIYDLLGRETIKSPIPSGKSSILVVTNTWSAGVYFLRIKSGNDFIGIRKLLKLR